jgi:PAS domain S-box-containing protein
MSSEKLDLYNLVAPLAGLGVWERDLRSKQLWANCIIWEILDASTDFLPDTIDYISICENPEEVQRKAHEVVTLQTPRVIVTPITSLRGNRKWVRVRMHGKYENGLCTHLYGTAEDITEEITIRKMLEEREQLFSGAFENAPIGMALVGLIGNWIKVNTSLCELLGYSEEEFTTHAFQDYTHPDDLQADLKLVEQLLRGEVRTYSMEKRYFHRNGSIVWAQLNVSLIRGSDERPLYFVSQIKELTGKNQHQ